jgi:hypothetical protein
MPIRMSCLKFSKGSKLASLSIIVSLMMCQTAYAKCQLEDTDSSSDTKIMSLFRKGYSKILTCEGRFIQVYSIPRSNVLTCTINTRSIVSVNETRIDLSRDASNYMSPIAKKCANFDPYIYTRSVDLNEIEFTKLSNYIRHMDKKGWIDDRRLLETPPQGSNINSAMEILREPGLRSGISELRKEKKGWFCNRYSATIGSIQESNSSARVNISDCFGRFSVSRLSLVMS